jgi:PilZ domain-containing protein
MTEQIDTPPSNVRSLPGSGQGKLTTPSGEQLPVRAFERGQDVVLVVLVNLEEPPDGDRLEPADLEYTSVRGVIKLRGEAVFEDRSLIRFHTHGDAKVMQRRSYVRVHTPTAVTVDSVELEELRAHTVDLSGGGMLLTGADDLAPGETVNFTIALGLNEPAIEGVGRVVRIQADGKRALTFEQIDETDRQRLIRFVFKCMRTARARTRGDWV